MGCALDRDMRTVLIYFLPTVLTGLLAASPKTSLLLRPWRTGHMYLEVLVLALLLNCFYIENICANIVHDALEMSSIVGQLTG